MEHVKTVRGLILNFPVTIKPDMSIQEAITVLLKRKVSGAIVVDEENRVLGMLSEKDCLRIFVHGAYNALPGARVSDYMCKEVVTIEPDTDLFSVAEIFINYHFRRLPVVENGVLIGQISRRDILEGSRRIWEASPIKKEWTDARYIPDEVQAKLDSKSS